MLSAEAVVNAWDMTCEAGPRRAEQEKITTA